MGDLSQVDIRRLISILPAASAGHTDSLSALLDDYGNAVVTCGTTARRVREARRWAEADERLLALALASEQGAPTLEGVCRAVVLRAGEEPDRVVALLDGNQAPAWETFAFSVRQGLAHMGITPSPPPSRPALGNAPIDPAVDLWRSRSLHPDDASIVLDQDAVKALFDPWGRARNDGEDAAVAEWLAQAGEMLPQLALAMTRADELEARRETAAEAAAFVHLLMEEAKPDLDAMREAARHVCRLRGEAPDEPIGNGPFPMLGYTRYGATVRRAAEFVGMIGRLDQLKEDARCILSPFRE